MERDAGILQKAIGRGLLTTAQAHEVLRKRRDAMGSGPAPDILALLHEVTGVERRLLDALDDRSMVGRRIAGFELKRKLGEGAMGAVYAATQLSLGREVAIKLLDPTLSLHPALAERLRREARAAAKLHHPHVVQPVDFIDDAGFLVFAMELLDGGSAADRLQEGPLEEAEVVRVGLAVARALAFAEESGLVHRDVKPDNILFSKQGEVKLADLGLVMSEADEQARPLTEPGLAVGTPDYMAPEQARGRRDLDIRTDIYALGVTLYELATGRRPYTGPDALAVVTQHLSAPIPDPCAARPALSRRFGALCRRMMAKEPAARFPSALALCEAFEALERGDPEEAPDEDDGPGGAAASLDFARDEQGGGGRSGEGVRGEEPAAEAGATPEGARVGGRRAPWALAGALVLLVGAGAATIAVRGLSGEPRDVTAATGAAKAAKDIRAESLDGLRALLGSRAHADGGLAYAPGAKPDAWSTAQGRAALVLAGADEGPEVGVVAALRGRALRDAGGALRGWPVLPNDTVAKTAVGCWVAIALAEARAAGEAGSVEACAEARAYLVSLQTEDGGFPSVPAAGEPSVRIWTTGLALFALTALDASSPDDPGPIERAAAWLGGRFDPGARGWPIEGARIAGLDEQMAWALLEAEALLAARGRSLPPAARAALEGFAEAPAPAPRDPDTVGASLFEQSLFALPAGARATQAPMRFVWLPWRLLVAERLARRTDLASAGEWEAAAAGARAAYDGIASRLAAAPTFHIAECLFAAALRRAMPEGEAPSLVASLRAGR